MHMPLLKEYTIIVIKNEMNFTAILHTFNIRVCIHLIFSLYFKGFSETLT